MSTHTLPHSPQPTPAKKLRPCLSPPRPRPASPAEDAARPASAMSTASSSYTMGSNGEWVERATKCVHWLDTADGNAVTKYFDTYSATEYDRTPLAPPSEAERACVLPARGSRCLSFLGLDDEADDEEEESSDDEEEILRRLPASPFATPEDSESEGGDDDDQWDECFERRRMMFARMCPLDSDAHPQFEGYRSLSATLVNLLKSVASDSDDDDDLSTTPRGSFHEREIDSADDIIAAGDVSPINDLPFPFFSRLREGSTDSEEVGTPSLVSSADSDTESGLMSPRGSAVDFLPPARGFLPSNNHTPSWKGVSPVRNGHAPSEHAPSDTNNNNVIEL